MRGVTLEEKRYGPGYRPEPVRFATLRLGHCAYEPCKDEPTNEVETWVDDSPPPTDEYRRVLSKLPTRTWVRIPLCDGHTVDFLARSLVELEDPDLWAPGRANPVVFPHPVNVFQPVATRG